MDIGNWSCMHMPMFLAHLCDSERCCIIEFDLSTATGFCQIGRAWVLSLLPYNQFRVYVLAYEICFLIHSLIWSINLWIIQLTCKQVICNNSNLSSKFSSVYRIHFNHCNLEWSQTTLLYLNTILDFVGDGTCHPTSGI